MRNRIKSIEPLLRDELLAQYWDNVNFELIERIKDAKREDYNFLIRKKIHNKFIQLRYCNQPMLRTILKDEIKQLERQLI